MALNYEILGESRLRVVVQDRLQKEKMSELELRGLVVRTW
jgi:hypothetical protein